MQLTNEEKLLVSSEMNRRGKNMLLAYILLIFLGTLGIHRFYIGKTGSAIAMLILTLVGWITAILIVGFVFVGISAVWAFVDLFLVPKMIEEANSKMEKQLIAEIGNNSNVAG